MKVLVYGSLNIDHVYRLPHFVREGETLHSLGYARSEGGKGFNQAVALARAGSAVCFAGAIGEDGRFLRDYLDSLGVDTGAVSVLDVPTGHAIIQVDAQGQNSIVLYGGANQAITPEMMDAVLDRFQPGDWLLMQNEISEGDVLLKKAAARGLHIALNPSPVSPALLSWPLELVDCFLLNEVEGCDLTGETDPEAILDGMLRRWPGSCVVLTLGDAGAIYADAARRIRQPVIPAKAVDTTAAGDTFTGYFLHRLLRGDGEAAAMHAAAQAAAITVSRPGAARSIPLFGEVDAALMG